MLIGLLQCDTVDDQYRSITSDYDEMFISLLGPEMPGADWRAYAVYAGELPAAVNECDAYLISGSRYSVYDDLDWVRALADFINALAGRDIKTVGICFGHQMIAHALGGTVRQSPRGWGVGVMPVRVTAARPWMIPYQETYRLLVSHQDQVEALPPGGESLGENEHCPISLYTIGPAFLGIQGHPELSREYVAAFMRSRADRIGHQRLRHAERTLATPTDELLIAGWIRAFLAG
jgi:GMP synthase-like glutamine amidotransferase